MNLKIVFSILLVALISKTVKSQENCPIVPLPFQVAKGTDSFLLDQNTAIIVEDQNFLSAAHYFQAELLRVKQIPLSIQLSSKKPAITIRYSTQKNAGASAYLLNINAQGITITAKDASGAFYGLVSILQIARQSKLISGTLVLASWTIKDHPLYPWRGIMLDESRHFFGKEKVKSILDWMAFYKLNKFHWHLTDEPAWRIEIKKYPRLGLIGGIGDYLNELQPAKYYSQEDVKEIVAYAAERFITVIPEIDMPGHATAANKAYPQFNGGGAPGHPDFTFNPGKEGTYLFLSNILREVNTLFPSGMVHLGGDEVVYGNQKWAEDSAIQDLMLKSGLKDRKEVESYFMKRMADSVYQMNAKLLVWDEMAESNLAKDKTIIFWWRQEKPAMLKLALSKGYHVVLCPRLPLYFDFVQDSTHHYGRKWNKLYNSLEDVYNFSKDNYIKESVAQDQILGIQANLWTETVQNEQRLDYLLFPRITALAEAAWSSERKDFTKFKQRLKEHLLLFREAGLYYFDPFEPNKFPEPVRIGLGIKRFDMGL
ncbi:beta-N-acetylhexosaminidase [Pedobacter sp. PAMC26386]|nr:beta-N-acetylhexosaminidase [Pedobacter sp. PAMC26386]